MYGDIGDSCSLEYIGEGKKKVTEDRGEKNVRGEREGKTDPK